MGLKEIFKPTPEQHADYSMQAILERNQKPEMTSWALTHAVKCIEYFGGSALIVVKGPDYIHGEGGARKLFAAGLLCAALGMREIVKAMIYSERVDQIEKQDKDK